MVDVGGEEYEWVTSEMFDDGLRYVLHKYSVAQLLAVPGAYEVFREELNNEVLEHLEQQRADAEHDERTR